jgi:hypothetical protein
MIPLRLLLFLPVAGLLQAGCASSDTSPSTGNVDASGNTISSTPWDKSESWENDGQLGAATGK